MNVCEECGFEGHHGVCPVCEARDNLKQVMLGYINNKIYDVQTKLNDTHNESNLTSNLLRDERERLMGQKQGYEDMKNFVEIIDADTEDEEEE